MQIDGMTYRLHKGDIIEVCGHHFIEGISKGQFWCVKKVNWKENKYVLVRYFQESTAVFKVKKPYKEIKLPIALVKSKLKSRFSGVPECFKVVVAEPYYKYRDYYVENYVSPRSRKILLTTRGKNTPSKKPKKVKNPVKIKKSKPKKEAVEIPYILKGEVIPSEIRVVDVSKILGLSRKTLYRDIKNKHLKAYKKEITVFSNRTPHVAYYVKKEDLRDYMLEQGSRFLTIPDLNLTISNSVLRNPFQDQREISKLSAFEIQEKTSEYVHNLFKILNLLDRLKIFDNIVVKEYLKIEYKTFYLVLQKNGCFPLFKEGLINTMNAVAGFLNYQGDKRGRLRK